MCSERTCGKIRNEPWGARILKDLTRSLSLSDQVDRWQALRDDDPGSPRLDQVVRAERLGGPEQGEVSARKLAGDLSLVVVDVLTPRSLARNEDRTLPG